MQIFSLSVRSLIILIVTCFLCSFRYFSASPVVSEQLIVGKWVCNTKSGQLNDITSYQLRCGGEVCFRTDHLVESATTDVFLPSGSRWAVVNARLVLFDTHGTQFAAFEIIKLVGNELIISRKGVDYGFEKSAD